MLLRPVIDECETSSPISRLAFIGNSLPRRCGIATFTTDLQQAISAFSPGIQTSIVAMTDCGQAYDYPPVVRIQVNESRISDYAHAAEVLNAGHVDVVSLQHEFGIFGGDAGEHIVELLQRLAMPVVTTLHTVLSHPSPMQRDVFDRVVRASSMVVVMAEKGRELLHSVYRAPAEKIEVIPHGIPNVAFTAPDRAKARLGFADRTVILTFGLLSPNKGIEVMIDAMPAILRSHPDAVYVVLGATHPTLVRHQGEAYRDSLVARAHNLGTKDHVIFLDQFVDLNSLLDHISMCDLYVTPYLNEAQMTSGTLAYSFGMGRAVVSTPYWHAQELLADGHGVLVPFGDSAAIGREIVSLLNDDARRDDMCVRAFNVSRSMTWERTAARYLAVFKSAADHDASGSSLSVIAQRFPTPLPASFQAPPKVTLGHLLSMCDDTGLIQHAVHSVADRSHGYCVDDNARALVLACALNRLGEERLPETLIGRFAAFVQHAWNPETARFRNFMTFDRHWLEASGSEDSHGRTLWALGECARHDTRPSRRSWALSLFAEALPSIEGFRSPRAWAFALLGLDAYCAAMADSCADDTRHVLAARLMSIMAAVQDRNWVWFEESLSYDNARLCQALILTGISTATPAYVDAGLRSLRWLMRVQTASDGAFWPVGTDGFGDKRTPPKGFDQQPLEATAMIAASLAAWRADGDEEWKRCAERAFDWFRGANALSLSLIDLGTGSCCDGLHPDRVNQNRGGESVVSYLLGLSDIRQGYCPGGLGTKFLPRLV